MGSLSHFDTPGGTALEGLRVRDDVLAGERALKLFSKHQSPKTPWLTHYIEGNHEERIKRWWNDNAAYEGMLDLSFEYRNYITTYTPYRHCLDINNVLFTHVPFNRARPIGGVMAAYKAAQLVTKSTVFGHTHKIGMAPFGRFGEEATYHSLNIGCFFEPEADPDYMDGRIKEYWRGVIKMEIEDDGQFDHSTLSLHNLRARYL